MKINAETFLAKLKKLILGGITEEEISREILLFMNMERYFLPKFREGIFYPRFWQQLNYADININYKQHLPNTPTTIKAAHSILSGIEDKMEAIHSIIRRTYISRTGPTKRFELFMQANLEETKMI